MSSIGRPGSQYLEFDEFIDYQIEKARTGIKWTDVVTAVVGVAALLLGYILVFTVFDQWVFPGGVPRGLRLALLPAVLATTAGWIVWKIVLPYTRRINPVYAARMIESAEPNLRGSLLGLVDARSAGRPPAPEVKRALEKRAATTLQTVDVEATVDRRPLLWTAYVLLGVVLIGCGYLIWSPKRVGPSILRSLLPTDARPVATRTEIVSVDPGNVVVLAGSRLPVTVRLRGERPERVMLFFSTADRRFLDEAVELKATDEATAEFVASLVGDPGRGLVQDLTYRIEAGDAAAGPFAVTVEQPPAATITEIAFDYPDYTGLADETRDVPPVEGVEGTVFRLAATANRPLRSARIVVADDERLSTRLFELPLTIADGTQLSATWTLELVRDAAGEKRPFRGFFAIKCRDAEGKENPNPSVYSVTILPDEKPQVVLHDPDRDLERPANAVVPLLLAARDPDFALRELTLRIEKNGQEVPGRVVLWEGREKEVAVRHDWDLATLLVKPGDLLEYYVEARDNREPEFNAARTPKLKITIKEPVAKEEVARQLAEDRERQEHPPQPPEGNPGGEEGAPDAGAKEPNGDPKAGEAQPGEQQAGETGAAGDSAQAGADSQPGDDANGGGGKSDKPAHPFRNDGSRDDEILQKLIDRQQEKQKEEQADRPQEGKPEQGEGASSGQSGKGNDGGKSGGGKSGGDKSGGDKTGGDKSGGDKTGGDKSGGEKSGGEKSGGETGGDGEKAGGANSGQSGEKGGGQDQGGENPDGQKPNGQKPDGKKPNGGGSSPDKADGGKQAAKQTGEKPNPAADSQGRGEKQQSSPAGEKAGGNDDAATKPEQSPANAGSSSPNDKPSGDGAKSGDGGAMTKQPGDSGDGPAEDRPGTGDEQGTPEAGGGDSPPPAGPENGASGAGEKSTRPPQAGDDPQKSRTADPGQTPDAGAGEKPADGTKSRPPSPADQPGAAGTSPSTEGRDQKPGVRPTPPSAAAPNPGPGEKDQRSESPDTGEAGGGTPNVDGNRDGRPGPGDAGAKPGTQQPADRPTGQPGAQPGKGSQHRPAGEKSAGETPSSTGQPAGKEEQKTQGEKPAPDGSGQTKESPQGENDSPQGQPPAGKKGEGKKGEGQQGKGQQGEGQGQQGEGRQGKGQSGKGGSGEGQGDEGQSGKGQEGQSGKGQGGKGQSGKGQEGDSSEGGGQSGQGGQAGKGGGATPGDGIAAGGEPSGGAGAADGGAKESGPETPNADYARRATDLTLRKIEDELKRGEVDDELLKELGWTQDDLKRFADRIRDRLSQPAAEESPQDAARRAEFEHLLENLDPNGTPAAREARTGRVKEVDTTNTQRTVPSAYRDAYERFTKRVAGRNGAE